MTASDYTPMGVRDMPASILLRDMINNTCPAFVVERLETGELLPASLHGNLRVYTWDLHCMKAQALVLHFNHGFPSNNIIDWMFCAEGTDIPDAWLRLEEQSTLGVRVRAACMAFDAGHPSIVADRQPGPNFRPGNNSGGRGPGS